QNAYFFRGTAELLHKGIRVEILSTSLYLTVPKDIYEQLGLLGKKIKKDPFHHVILLPLLSKKKTLLERARTYFGRVLPDTLNFIFCGNSECKVKSFILLYLKERMEEK
ncbi:hypothetical protein HMI55_001903, partial [Coelomomyces lativittatus]